MPGGRGLEKHRENWARKEETGVSGKTRCDSKYEELVENADQLVQGLLRTWIPSLEKHYEA